MNRNSALDIAKYIAALLVIGIHTRPLADLSTEADFWLVEVLCRLAVPFFAVCSGFYLYPASSNLQNNRSFRQTWVKIVSMYVGWSVFYLLIHLYQWYDSDTLCPEYLFGWVKGYCELLLFPSMVLCSINLWHVVVLDGMSIY